MSTETSKDDVSNANPYTAPRSLASFGSGNLLTYVIFSVIVLGFLFAGTFAYWAYFDGYIDREPYEPPPGLDRRVMPTPEEEAPSRKQT